MKRILAILLILGFFLTNGISLQSVSAQTTADYIYQYLSPKNISGADDLKTKLEAEVKKITDPQPFQHLAPFRAAYGEIRNPANGQFYWYHRYDTIYTLSLAYPYLTPATQTAVKNYMQSEMTTYPLWTTTLLPVNQGIKRQPDELTAAEYGSLPSSYSTRPKLFALYSLWLYAQNTGDWTYIQNNWSTISNFYNTNRSELTQTTTQQYTSIAGAVGFVRLAKQKIPPDTSALATTTALNDINTAFTNGKNFTTFADHSFNAYQFDGGEGWQAYMWNGMYLGFQFLDITPEIGRYMREDAGLKSAVLGSFGDKYSLARVEYYWPIWYMAQAPVNTVYFGEGSGNPPDTRAMVFPIKNWVQQKPASELRKYLDVPDALIGDYYYLQNVIRTIEASGTECWENIQTTSQECVNSATSPTPTTQPPSPTPVPGDVNGDSYVTLVDLTTLLGNFGKSGLTDARTLGDLDGNGSVNLSDLSQLLANFGK